MKGGWWTPGKETLAGVVDALAATIYSPKVLAALPAGNTPQGLKEFIDLAIKAERLEVIAPILRRRNPELQGKLNLLLALARAGEDKLAGTLGVPANVAYSAEGLPSYSKELAGDLPKVLALVPERDRYRAEVVFASQADAEGEEAPAVERGKRLQALAKRFEAEAPQLRVPRWEILSALTRDREAARMVREAIVEETASLNLAAAITLKQESNSREGAMIYEMIMTSIRLDLASDQNERPMAHFQSLIGMTGNNAEYYGSQTANEIVEYFWRNFLRQAAVSKESAVALVPHADSLYKTMLGYANRSGDMARSTRGMALAVHALAGDSEGFFSFVDALPEQLKKAESEAGGKREFGENFSKIGNDRWLHDDMAPVRQKILVTFFNDPVILEKGIDHLTDLSSLFDEKFFTQEEVCQAIENLPEDHPRKAEFLCEKAGISAWRNKKIEESEALYQRAYELAEKQNNDFAMNLIRGFRGLMLAAHDRIGEAWKYGKAVDVELLPEQDRESFKKHLPAWEKAATVE